MNPISKKIKQLAAVLMVSVLFGFTQFGYAAQPVFNTSATLSFDHTKTGFLLRDIHATLRCEQCHVDGIFKNTPRDCAGCHALGTRVGATPKPANHVQTTQACDACHTSPTSFLVKSFKHIGIVSGCANCHNNQSLGVVSKPMNHFPTLQPCENCHTNTSTFIAWRMDHTGITTGCVMCHGNNVELYPGVVFKPVLHIATNDPCEYCHSVNLPTFGGSKYDHSVVTPGTCVTCHNGASAYAGAQGQSPGHLPVLGAKCDDCHTQTANFSTWLNDTYSHGTTGTSPNPTSQCNLCHNGSYTGYSAQGQNAGHTPTLGMQCDVCHTPSNTTNFTTFRGAGIDHAALVPPAAGRCSSAGCHDGSATNLGAQALSSYPTHIATAGAQCDTCHTPSVTQNYTTFLGALYDHSTMNPPAAGRCSTCHNGTNATGKIPTHILTVAQCDTCHKSQAGISWLGSLFHANPGATPITGVCGGSSCHDGSPAGIALGATGKSAVHLSTVGAACDTCHTVASTQNFSTWLGASFTHGVGQVGVCQTCHNGVQAMGKSVPHIPTTNGASCDSAGCHTNLASVYNVPANAGVITAWGGATYGHTGVVAGSCGTCHNGSYPGVSSQTMCYGATGCPSPSPFAHVTTSAPCDQCHSAAVNANNTTWAGAGHTHVAADLNQCAKSGCHNPGGAGKGVTTNHIPVYANSCDAGGCHANPVGVANPLFSGGNMVHSLYPSPAYTCGSCHAGQYPGFGKTGAVPKVSNHIPTTITGTLDCNTCHKGTPPNTAAASTGGAAAWATGEVMNHNSAQGMGAGGVYCVNCHLSGVTYLGKMQKKSHNGASTAKDCSSSKCHIPLGSKGKAYSSWT